MTVQPLLILADMDGCTSEWAGGIEQTLDSRGYGTHFLDWSRWEGVRHDATVLQRLAFASAMATPGFYRHLEPIPGAAKALNGMLAAGHEVLLCSTPDKTNPSCPTDKRDWAEEHLGAGWGERLILSHDKTLIHGDILIDDKPTITGRRPPSWEHVLFHQEYNAHITDRRRITDWNDWEAVLQCLE